MPQYFNNDKQSTSCNIENCKRCNNKYNCAQYITYLEQITTTTANIPTDTQTPIVSFDSILSNEIFVQLQSEVCQISQNVGMLSDAMGYLVTVFKEHENNTSNQNNEVNTENGLSIYDGNFESNTALVEKKGLFGKTKWVEEKVK